MREYRKRLKLVGGGTVRRSSKVQSLTLQQQKVYEQLLEKRWINFRFSTPSGTIKISRTGICFPSKISYGCKTFIFRTEEQGSEDILPEPDQENIQEQGPEDISPEPDQEAWNRDRR